MEKTEAFDISLYDDKFFAWHKEHAHEYSVKTMTWYMDNVHPKSVIDFGCGIGSYLYAARQRGVTNLKGYDIGGEYAKTHTPELVQPFIEYKDEAHHYQMGI